MKRNCGTRDGKFSSHTQGNRNDMKRSFFFDEGEVAEFSVAGYVFRFRLSSLMPFLLCYSLLFWGSSGFCFSFGSRLAEAETEAQTEVQAGTEASTEKSKAKGTTKWNRAWKENEDSNSIELVSQLHNMGSIGA